jgi:hypothetical protein
MDEEKQGPESAAQRPLLTGLHPAVYKTLICCALGIAVGAWLFDAQPGTYSMAFVAIGFFAVVAATIPSVLAYLRGPRERGERQRFGEWSHGDLEVYGHDRIEARSAAAAILIAPLAGAVGLVLLAVIDRLVLGGVL